MSIWRLAVVLACAVVCSSVYTPPARSQEPGSDSLALEELRDDVERAVARRKGSLRSARVGIAVRDLATGKVLYELDPAGLYNAASNTKLVTTSAALALLGPDFRLRTEALAEEVDEDGVVPDALYVRGRGNPAFGIDAMGKLARSIADAGVTKIRGGIVIDDTYFDEVDLPPHFDEQPDEHASFRAPVGSTSLNFNMVNLIVKPAARGRGAARLTVFPPADYVKVVGTIDTVRRGRTRIRVEQKEEDEHLVLEVDGQIRRDAHSRRFRRRVPDPVRYFATALRAQLAAKGVVVASRDIGDAEVPDEAHLVAVHESPPLAVVLRGLGKYSNNYVAEMVLKIIGAELVADGDPATWDDATSAVDQYLREEVGFPADGYRYDNGSGLFSSNEFSPRLLVELLDHAYRDFRWGPEFVASLSIAGADGTLSHRMVDTVAERQIRAKTGTLAEVSALSGYAAIDGRAPLAFSVLVNDIPQWKGGDARDLQDDVAAALIRYLHALRAD